MYTIFKKYSKNELKIQPLLYTTILNDIFFFGKMYCGSIGGYKIKRPLHRSIPRTVLLPVTFLFHTHTHTHISTKITQIHTLYVFFFPYIPTSDMYIIMTCSLDPTNFPIKYLKIKFLNLCFTLAKVSCELVFSAEFSYKLSKIEKNFSFNFLF